MMAIHMLLHNPVDYITSASGFRTFANLVFGANGTDEMLPELVAGTSAYSADYSNLPWDAELEDGLDSGEVSVQFDANLIDGTSSLSATGGSPVLHEGATGGTIGSVVIAARASVEGEIIWSDLTVTFWNGASIAESISIENGPTANAANTSTNDEEQRLVLTPQSASHTHVTVSGTLRLVGPANAFPGYSDLFGQILIMPA